MLESQIEEQTKFLMNLENWGIAPILGCMNTQKQMFERFSGHSRKSWIELRNFSVLKMQMNSNWSRQGLEYPGVVSETSKG